MSRFRLVLPVACSVVFACSIKTMPDQPNNGAPPDQTDIGTGGTSQVRGPVGAAGDSDSLGSAGDSGLTGSAGEGGASGGKSSVPVDEPCFVRADTCPTGTYCSAGTCTPGCKNAQSCASASCGPQHDCDHCLSDSECAGGRVCATGVCMDACVGEGTDCGGGRTCCGGRCVDTSRDVANCGGCGGPSKAARAFVCSDAQFCGTLGCAQPIVANVCSNAEVVLVTDGLAGDISAAAMLQAAFAGGCTPAPKVRTVAQTKSDVSNPLSGQPVAGSGQLVAIAGGAYGQRLVKYLEDKKIAIVKQTVMDDHFDFRRSSDSTSVAGMPWLDATATHDIFALQVVRDPASGTPIFVVAGFNESGTGAGAWYFSNVILPSLAKYDQGLYIYEWTDAGDKAGPDAADTFTLLRAGE